MRREEYRAGDAGAAIARRISDEIVDGLMDNERGAVGVGETERSVIERPRVRTQQKHTISILVSNEIADVSRVASVHLLVWVEM